MRILYVLERGPAGPRRPPPNGHSTLRTLRALRAEPRGGRAAGGPHQTAKFQLEASARYAHEHLLAFRGALDPALGGAAAATVRERGGLLIHNIPRDRRVIQASRPARPA